MMQKAARFIWQAMPSVTGSTFGGRLWPSICHSFAAVMVLFSALCIFTLLFRVG